MTSQRIRSLRHWPCHDWSHNWSRQGESDCSLTRNKLTGTDKGESDCLIKPGIFRLLSSVQCSEIREYLWSDVMEWIHDEYSVVGTHRLFADASAGEIWYCLDMWRTGADREYSSCSDCGRDRRSWIFLLHRLWKKITEVNIPVPRNVEEIAEVSKSSSEWQSILNPHFEEIKVFLGWACVKQASRSEFV